MSDVTPQGFPGERSEGHQSSGKKCRRKIRENDEGQGNTEKKEREEVKKKPKYMSGEGNGHLPSF